MQLDVLVIRVVGGIGAESIIGRVIKYFADDDWTDLWSCIGIAQGGCDLGWELIIPGADYVTPERNPILRRTKVKAVNVASQVGVGVAGEKINFLAQGTQRETA